MLFHLKTIFIAGLMMAGCLTGAHAAANINLTVDGVRNASGKVYVFVFDNAAAFEDIDLRKAIDYSEINAKPGPLKHVFKGLGAGPYAIMLFHDENGDGDLNMNGETPLEGFGLSGSSGPDDLPGFGRASFAPGAISIKIHYLN
jgi:uncharacterized protein (DUF2141 family)